MSRSSTSAPPITLVLRTTFRLHDNPALHYTLHGKSAGVQRIVLPILTDHVDDPESIVPTADPSSGTVPAPRFRSWTQTKQHAWGYHQYTFLLHAIRTFVCDVQKCLPPASRPTIEIVWGTAAEIVRHVCHPTHGVACRQCVCDVTEDAPMWGTFDALLQKQAKASSAELRWIVTNTLLDWRSDGPHHTFLAAWGKSKHNQKMKDYVARQLNEMNLTEAVKQTHCGSVVAKPRAVTMSASSTRRNRSCRRTSQTRATRSKSVDTRAVVLVGVRFRSGKVIRTEGLWALDTEIRMWESVMQNRGIVPFVPPSGKSCESWALQQLDACAESMARPEWEKPQSASSLDVRQHATNPLRNTSKLSPFFALGVISPRAAYLKWKGHSATAASQNAKRPSSAVAQLLWRETFHAASYLPGFWDTREDTSWNDPSPPRFWCRDVDWDVTCGDDPKLAPFLRAKTGLADLDQALHVLVRDGWVHHLRRHIIADYLTRGKLKCDWMVGESWFRQTLVDHDACLNRCNWLWLSACEFSTAQLMRHYGWGTYVQRQSKGVTISR